MCLEILLLKCLLKLFILELIKSGFYLWLADSIMASFRNIRFLIICTPVVVMLIFEESLVQFFLYCGKASDCGDKA